MSGFRLIMWCRYCAVLTTVLATSSTFSVKQLQSELAAAMGQVASKTV